MHGYLFTYVTVAFLHLWRSSESNVVLVQHFEQLCFTLIKATIVDWSRLDHGAVWVFLNIENPLSESAFEHGIDKRQLKSRLAIKSIHL